MKKDAGFQNRYEKMRRQILGHEAVQQFVTEHADQVDTNMINRSLNNLYEFIHASHQCAQCPSLEGCINMIKGLEPKLKIQHHMIEVEYVKCPSRIKEDARQEVADMIESMYMSKDVMEATLLDVDFDHQAHESRLTLIEKARDFLNEYDETGVLPKQGFYIHGPFGIGKSFILGALANELAERHIKTIVVFVPEFLREIKQSIQEQTLNEKIDYVKKAPILMLDDFGAETLSNWVRDEVLGAILQYRMAEQLPTFFTSNLGFKELQQHLAITQRGEKDVVKAARIMERIKVIAEPIALAGENRRLP